jgi:hypothetical protein
VTRFWRFAQARAARQGKGPKSIAQAERGAGSIGVAAFSAGTAAAAIAPRLATRIRARTEKLRSGALLESWGGTVARVDRKLVAFVPADALDAVRDAVFAAGAGRIGDYERCSWYAEGTGTFLGGEATSPAVGERGQEERVAELRLETVYPVDREAEVVRALRAAHPYEEPAFDLYVLAEPPA